MYRSSPAVEAGVHIGDIVTAVDGKPVHSAQETLAQIAAKKPGSRRAAAAWCAVRSRGSTLTAWQSAERPQRQRASSARA